MSVLCASPTPSAPVRPLDLIAADSLLSDEERAIRDTVRLFGTDQLRPHIAEWFEQGTIPARDLATQLGGLGVLGMHLEGYGCAGTNAVSYGLACLELEAVDSGDPLARQRAGIARHVRHLEVGQRGTKARMVTSDGHRRGHRMLWLTEPDFGSNPAGMRTHRQA